MYLFDLFFPHSLFWRTDISESPLDFVIMRLLESTVLFFINHSSDDLVIFLNTERAYGSMKRQRQNKVDKI